MIVCNAKATVNHYFFVGGGAAVWGIRNKLLKREAVLHLLSA